MAPFRSLIWTCVSQSFQKPSLWIVIIIIKRKTLSNYKRDILKMELLSPSVARDCNNWFEWHSLDYRYKRIRYRFINCFPVFDFVNRGAESPLIAFCVLSAGEEMRLRAECRVAYSIIPIRFMIYDSVAYFNFWFWVPNSIFIS